MNNLSSYCGLVDTKIRASDKDLPVKLVQLLAIMEFSFLLFLPTRGVIISVQRAPVECNFDVINAALNIIIRCF